MTDTSVYSPLLNAKGELTVKGKLELRTVVWNVVAGKLGDREAYELLGGTRCPKIVPIVPRPIPVDCRPKGGRGRESISASDLPGLGLRFLQARRVSGISQSGLGRRLQLSRKTIMRIESERFRFLDVKQLGRITEWLDSRDAQ